MQVSFSVLCIVLGSLSFGRIKQTALRLPKYAGFSGILENDFHFDSWKFSLVRFCEK